MGTKIINLQKHNPQNIGMFCDLLTTDTFTLAFYDKEEVLMLESTPQDLANGLGINCLKSILENENLDSNETNKINKAINLIVQ